MQQQIQTPWREGYNFGIGVDPGGGCATGLGRPADALASGSPGWISRVRGNPYRHPTSDLQDTLQISAEASGGCGLFSASARFDFAKDCKVHSESLFMTVYAVADNAFQSIDDVLLTPDAAAHAADPLAFQERFGSVFVRGLRTGGLFVGVVQVESSSKDTQEHVGGEISASYAAFEAKISASHNTKTRQRTKPIARFSTTRGAIAGDHQCLRPNRPRTLFAAAKIWAATVGANGVPYHVTLAPIAIAGGAPKPPDPAGSSDWPKMC